MSALLLLCGVVVPFCAHAELQAVPFPKTYADVSFADRVAVETEAYQPFMDKSVYESLDIVPGEEIYTDSMLAKMEAEQAQEQTPTTTDFPTPDIGATDLAQPIQPIPPTQIAETPQPSYPVSPTPTTRPTYSGDTIGGGTVVENNIVTGGSCYPPARDKNFTSTIYTTGKYEKVHPALEKALITLFRKEGGCGTVKNDPLGYTCYGVTSYYFPQVKNPGFSRADAEEIYYNNYWKKYHLERLPDVISGDIFLAGVGSGTQTAIQRFSMFLGIKKTTSVNNEMINAVNNYNGDIHNKWMDYRDKWLQEIAHSSTYKGSVSRGWKNGIILKRKNGCHVRPAPNEVLTR